MLKEHSADSIVNEFEELNKDLNENLDKILKLATKANHLAVSSYSSTTEADQCLDIDLACKLKNKAKLLWFLSKVCAKSFIEIRLLLVKIKNL